MWERVKIEYVGQLILETYKIQNFVQDGAKVGLQL